MGTINSSNFAKSLWPGINKWYGDAYAEHATQHTDLFDKYSSRKAFEDDVSTSYFGLAPIKGEGSGVSYDTASQGFTSRYQHVVYALGFVITREMKEDDLYDVIGSRNSRSLAMSMNQTKETIAANVYNNGFDSNYTGGDGVEMLSTAHVNVAGGTYANKLTTDADLSEAALEQACIDLMNHTNDRGLLVNIMAKQSILPVELIFEAERILGSVARVGTADNDLNALKSMGKFQNGVVYNNYLTDADAWFIRTTAPDGMKHFERRADDFALDNDFDTDNAKFKASGRYSFGWSDPRGIFGSQGA